MDQDLRNYRYNDEFFEGIPPEWTLIASGGEAQVYEVDEETIAKIYHHPKSQIIKLMGEDASKIALERFETAGSKLVAIMQKVLPKSMLIPKGILMSKRENVVGFVMNKLPKTAISFDILKTMPMNVQLKALRALCNFLHELHYRGVVFGDLVPKDIFWDVENNQLHVLDVDAIQFDEFFCKTVTIGYADRRVLNFTEKGGEMILTLNKHDQRSDWYAFYAICLFVLTGVELFKGVDRSTDIVDPIRRVADNVTIFNHKRVEYPCNAKKLHVIPKKLLKVIYAVVVLGKWIIPSPNMIKEES